jgi:hypothetical protein
MGGLNPGLFQVLFLSSHLILIYPNLSLTTWEVLERVHTGLRRAGTEHRQPHLGRIQEEKTRQCQGRGRKEKGEEQSEACEAGTGRTWLRYCPHSTSSRSSTARAGIDSTLTLSVPSHHAKSPCHHRASAEVRCPRCLARKETGLGRLLPLDWVSSTDR